MSGALRTLRRRFWFAVMDAANHAHGWCRDLYLYAVGKASDATDWGPPLPVERDAGKEPW